MTYARPFGGEPAKDHSHLIARKFLTKAPGFDTTLHNQLTDLRNTVVAHSDATIEDSDIVLLSTVHRATVKEPPVEVLYVPATAVLGLTSLMGFRKEVLDAVSQHVDICHDAVFDEIKRKAEALRQYALARA